MIRLRRAESDADLEAWRRVRAAVLPNERAASVEEMRRMDTGDTVRLLAELDGELAGSGIAARMPRSAYVAGEILAIHCIHSGSTDTG